MGDKKMKLYSYKGPVTLFGVCIDNNWAGTTYAVSENKARSNLAYQYKKLSGRIPKSKIELPGKIFCEE